MLLIKRFHNLQLEEIKSLIVTQHPRRTVHFTSKLLQKHPV
jgi:hypothetical protein